MSPSPQLAPPGSSTYSSDSLYVGDGTWDSQRNTFLLPNLMGVNFATMQYNGMGNRFRDVVGYHSIIKAHGVIAAITFLGIVPGAILIARFYSPNPHFARRLHIWMQVLTVLLSTVVFVLGWFAVGRQRSLTNPHHGIGLAIYVLIIAQMFWGWFMHKRRGRRRPHIPLKVMLHHWLGRLIALLGIVQIPLGLTLYGSPKSLFILYTLAASALVLAYFILTYLHERRLGADYDTRGSYSSGPEVVDDKSGHHNFGRVAAAGVAAAGLGGLLGKRFRRGRGGGGSRSTSPTGYYSEATSYYDRDNEKSGWGKKLAQGAALIGAGTLAKKWWDRRRDRESDSESGHYRRAHTVTDSAEDSISHAEEGRRPRRGSGGGHYDGPGSPEQSRYNESEYAQTDEGRRGHGIRNAILGAGALTGIRQFFKNRQDKKDDRRLEEVRRAEMHDERMARAQNRRYTGDGQGPRRSGRRASVSDLSGPTDPNAIHSRPADVPPPVPVHGDGPSVSGESADQGPRRHRSTSAAGAAVGTAEAGPSSGHRRRSGGREDSVDSQPVSIKVRMHDHGRSITLRQLTGEEASASRDARRRDRHRRSGRHRRDGSISGTEGDDQDHWRRVEERERQQEEEEAEASTSRQRRAHTPDPAAAEAESPGAEPLGPAPPHPPVPPGESFSSQTGFSPLPRPPVPGGTGGVGSPLSTELSGSYASRSGRRRAERRTQAKGGRRQGVEFT